jgi:polysaccharide transporter, PST family
MLVVNVVQRAIGLLRNLGFCHVLDDAALGRWAMANSFFLIAAPMICLGLPGALGKFVEVYRVRGQLGSYLRVTAYLSLVCVSCFLLLVTLRPQFFSWLVFNEATSGWGIAWLALTVVSVFIFNSINELAAAMRHVRLVSLMQFINSVSFAVLAGLGLWWRQDWLMLLPTYCLACLLGALPGVWLLLAQGPFTSEQQVPLPLHELWSRILPFAFMLWCNNLLVNTFELCDRYMLLHMVSGGGEVGQALAGQYHCGRILPGLLLSLATLFCGILLPYLSADWEAGRKDQVESRLNHSLQMVSLSFTCLAIASLLAAPWLFNAYLGGRYDAAQEILPQVLLQCVWSGLYLVAQAYLLCMERGGRMIGIQVFALLLNLILNYLLISRFELAGAVTATTISFGVVMVLVIGVIRRQGGRLRWSTLGLCLLPLSLLFGPLLAALAASAVLVIAGRTEWLLTASDRAEIDRMLLPKLAKLGVRLDSLW